MAEYIDREAALALVRPDDPIDERYAVTVATAKRLSLYIQGDAEAHHLVAALWNIAWAVEQEIKRPEMVDLPERGEHSGIAF